MKTESEGSPGDMEPPPAYMALLSPSPSPRSTDCVPTPTESASPTPETTSVQNESAPPTPKNDLTINRFVSWGLCAMVVNIWGYANYIWGERNDHNSLPLWIIMAIGLGLSGMIYQKTNAEGGATVRYLTICVAIIFTDYLGYKWFGSTWEDEMILDPIKDFIVLFGLGWDIALFLDFVTRGVRVDYGMLNKTVWRDFIQPNVSTSEQTTREGHESTHGSSLGEGEQRRIIRCFLGSWAMMGFVLWVSRLFIELVMWIPWSELFLFGSNEKGEQPENDSSLITAFVWMLMAFIYCLVLSLPFAIGHCQLDEEEEKRRACQRDVEMGEVRQSTVAQQ